MEPIELTTIQSEQEPIRSQNRVSLESKVNPPPVAPPPPPSRPAKPTNPKQSKFLTSAEVKAELIKLLQKHALNVQEFLSYASKDLATLEPIGALPKLKSTLSSYVLKFKTRMTSLKSSEKKKADGSASLPKPGVEPSSSEQPAHQASVTYPAQAKKEGMKAARVPCPSLQAPASEQKCTPPL